MAYQKQNFVDGKPLSAAELNRMEEGIAAAMEAGGGNVPGGGNVDLTGYAKEAWVQENYQPKDDYPLRSELPDVPVQSVNGKTGAVSLGAEDVGARPSTWMPTAADVGALPNTYKPPNQTAQQVGADPAGTAANAVSGHNSATDAHSDIRLQLTVISDRLKAFFDSDDQTLDELSEIVAYITSNKSLIDAITTSKVSVLDIVNDLVTNVPAKPLSAAQGVVLKGLIDTVSSSLANYLPTSQLSSAIDTALAQAKASGEFDGQRGTGILNVTSSTTSESGTGPTGIEIKYKIALSTVKDEAGVDEVLVGDTVKRSVYLYPVANVDASYVYLGAYTSIKGSTGTSVTVKSVAESSESGGNNVVTFSDNKTLTVKNGKDGRDPVRGTDYWTEADQEAIVQQVITALGTPVFGTVDAGKRITLTIDRLADGTYELGYEDKDGNWVKICDYEKTSEPEQSYTNQIPLSINADGTQYVGTNGEKGYKLEYRLNSSGNETAVAGESVFATGFIPVTNGDAVYLGNMNWPLESGAAACRAYFQFYDSSFNKVEAMLREVDTGIDWWFPNYAEKDDNNNLTTVYIKSGIIPEDLIDAVAYIRVSAYYTGEMPVITINEPIV